MIFFLFTLDAGSVPLGTLPPPAALAGVQLANSAASTLATGPPQFPPVPDQVLVTTYPSPLLPTGSREWPPQGHGGDLSLSLASRPIPAKIVHQIRSGRFVEMRDLLDDNITVKRHFEELHRSMGMQLLQVTSKPKVREVSTLPVWVCCYLTYLAVGTNDPVTPDRLAYAVLLIREAMKHGGQGWIEYNRLFRQQAALNPNLPWNIFHPGLQSSTILGQRQAASSGTFCSLCQGCDHIMAQCALTQLQQPTVRGGQVHTNYSKWPGWKNLQFME